MVDRWFRFQFTDQPVLLAILFLVSVLHTLSSISDSVITLILATFKVVIYGTFVACSATGANPSHSRILQDMLDGVPLDVRTVLSRIAIEPEYELYACCPKCFTLYPPDDSRPNDRYPHVCTRRIASAEPECGASLVSAGASIGHFNPCRTFALQSLRGWLAQLLSRPEIERAFERSWSSARTASQGVWSDILESPVLQKFLGPDDSTLYSIENHGELHLAFSLNIDWFNPFGNKAAGRSYSIGAIYLACLNLPPHMRYKPENIFLAGVIPGPREPTVDQVNYLLEPLISELLVFWRTGVHFSRTALRPFGRKVRAAIIPVVCDLPAARKVSGFIGHSADKNFCSFCLLSRSGISQIYDRVKWGFRSYYSHLEEAQKMRDATTLKTRRELFAKSGIRWSELLRLPYWDPTQYTVIDAMHNLYLGELKHHCSQVLGIDACDPDKQSGTSKVPLHDRAEQSRNLEGAARAVMSGNINTVLGYRKGYILAIAQLNEVPLPGASFVKKDIASALIDWVRPACNLFEGLLKDSTPFVGWSS